MLIPGHLEILMMQAPKDSPQSRHLALFVVNWHLREEITILRLMLYGEEWLPQDSSYRLHNDNLLSKIMELEKELADDEDQLTA